MINFVIFKNKYVKDKKYKKKKNENKNCELLRPRNWNSIFWRNVKIKPWSSINISKCDAVCVWLYIYENEWAKNHFGD